jgi:IS30 family transposase
MKDAWRRVPCRLLLFSETQLPVCAPYASWQKGGVENVNRMLRRYFPKRTDFRDVSQREIDRVVDLINKKPRKILEYRSAYEVALEHGVVLGRGSL